MTIYPAPKPRRAKRKPSGPHRMKKSRLKSRGARTKKSGGALFPKTVNHEYRDFVRAQPCAIWHRWEQRGHHSVWCGIEPLDRQHDCTGRVQACHVTSRGAGGADVGNLYAGCAAAHHEQHAIGIPAFEARWGIDLRAEALRLQALYESQT